MKKTSFRDVKSSRFFGGKGFYIALAVSLAAVGGAAWLGVNSAMNKLSQQQPPSNQTQNQSTPTYPNADWEKPNTTAPVETKKDNIPAESDAKTDVKPEAAVAQGYILPIKGDLLNGYSGDKVVKSKTLDDWVMHTGIDISAPVSTPVKSMSSGKVTAIQNDSLWGTTVTIDHGNGILSYYANLKSAVNVTLNQIVKMGDVIGAVGETCDIERAEESHLHFGVKKNNNWTDPFSIAK